ncbi:hypothetical protein [Tenacibaculum sp. Bg11-29]|uniref:hypothetical protein n=1 Tax=Tenacibaculum sp. Bg11-29 TaxID=2058306 RepID=UPI0012FF17BF|nr:hypothetical protein [Tenacibaculum sp. Bg11-29]
MKTSFKVSAFILALGFILFCMYKNNIVPKDRKQQTQVVHKRDITAPGRENDELDYIED